MRPFMLRFAGPRRRAGSWWPARRGCGVHRRRGDLPALGGGGGHDRDRGPPPRSDRRSADPPGFRREIGEGWAFVRRNPWCWATLIAALLSLLTFFGPLEIAAAVPAEGGPGGGGRSRSGLIFAAGGGRRGPRRPGRSVARAAPALRDVHVLVVGDRGAADRRVRGHDLGVARASSRASSCRCCSSWAPSSGSR